jgi:hypothetical protein
VSLLPNCTCGRYGSGFPVMFGKFDKGCPRHGSSASWLEKHMARRAADLKALREQALTRPTHGGYPVVARELNTTLVVDQKTANVTNNGCDLCKGTGVADLPDPWGGVRGTCPDCHGSGGVEFDRDTDGELLIDWSPAPGRMLSLSLRADGRMAYAFHWDGETAHGTAQMPVASALPDGEQPK